MGVDAKIDQIQTCILRSLHLVMVKSCVKNASCSLKRSGCHTLILNNKTGCESMETKKYKLCARRPQ